MTKHQKQAFRQENRQPVRFATAEDGLAKRNPIYPGDAGYEEALFEAIILPANLTPREIRKLGRLGSAVS